MEERSENDRDHHPTCFLCLKPSRLPNLKEEEPISLRTIHRYLNLQPGGGGGGGGGCVGGGGEVCWWFCENCNFVTTKLSDLCEQLEVIQMKVNHSLELFYSKLLEGEEEMEHHPRRPRNSAFYKVREQTLEQCERNLRHAKRLSVHLKKVQVARANQNHPRTTAYQPSHSTSVPPPPPPPEVVIKTEPEPMMEEEDEQDFREPFIPQGAHQPPTDSLLLKFLKGRPSSPPPPQIHSSVFPATVAPSLPANQLTTPSKQLINCSNYPLGGSLPAIFMGKSAVPHQEARHRHHQSNHLFNYPRHLVDDLGTTSRSVAVGVAEVPKRTRGGGLGVSTGLDLSGTGKCCPDCGAEFARRNLVKRHQIESCVFRRDKSKSSRKPTECPDCGVTFLHPGSFYHHRKEKHPHKAKGSMNMHQSTSSVGKSWNNQFL